MSRVFADTHFFITLLSRRDANHQRALDAYRDSDFDEIVTTAWVLGDLADGMCQPGPRLTCKTFVEKLRERAETRIVEPTSELFWRGFELYAQRPDKAWSLTDCISFVVMRDEQIANALTGDHHFQQAGFTA